MRLEVIQSKNIEKGKKIAFIAMYSHIKAKYCPEISFFKYNVIGSFRVKSTNFWQISSSTISDFDTIFTECALMY